MTAKSKHLKFAILILTIVGISFIQWHKFYVSLTEIKIVPEKNAIEISMRIFPDDLDWALEKIHGINPNIATEIEVSKADNWLDEYIHSNFEMNIDGIDMKYKYLGKTMESDAVWCFLEIETDLSPKKLTIRNSILTEEFEDQKNIVQVYFQEKSKGMLLDRYQQSSIITF